ncbi:unnamed protein product [Closterium sp. NIES-53]
MLALLLGACNASVRCCVRAAGGAWHAQCCGFMAAEAGRWPLGLLLLLLAAAGLAMRLLLAAAGASNVAAASGCGR